jgi:hypothetical protein
VIGNFWTEAVHVDTGFAAQHAIVHRGKAA